MNPHDETAGSEPWAHDEIVHAWWVRPGRLMAGEYPGAKDKAHAREKIELLLEAGVRTFLDLTTPDDRLRSYRNLLAEVAEARQLDVRHEPFPIPDLNVVDDDLYDEVVQTIEAGMTRGAVYVHCWGGVGRTGTVIGCVLADEGLSYAEVIERLDALRSATRKSHRRAPEMGVQLELLRRRASQQRSPRRSNDVGGAVCPRIEVVRGDITSQQVDAIVNAAKPSLSGGGGVDGAIHRAAGRRLAKAAVGLAPCAPGDAKATPAFRLDPPVRWIIHTVGPRWSGGGEGESDLLASCYRRSLELADELGARSVAFPAISTGVYRFPLGLACEIAVATISSTKCSVELVRLVAYDEETERALLAAADAS